MSDHELAHEDHQFRAVEANNDGPAETAEKATPLPSDGVAPAEPIAAAKFKKRKIPSRFVHAEISESDCEVTVLCSLQTLLATSKEKKFGGERGQIPCEGHFIVVPTMNPMQPIFEAGFVLCPQKSAYAQTKEALSSLKNRVDRIHGINPTAPRAGAGWSELDSDLLVTQKPEDVNALLLKVVQNCTAAKGVVTAAGEAQPTTLFLTPSDGLEAAQMSLQWFQDATRGMTFGSHLATVKRISDLFPVVTEFVSDNPHVGRSLEDDSERCVAHPRMRVNEYGKPFSCAREQCRMLQRTLGELAAGFADDSS